MTEVRRQIDRIEANITAALEAVATKGVTVPVGANSDDLARLIAVIGMPLYPLTNTSRTFTDGATITVTEGNYVSVVSPESITDEDRRFGFRDLSFNTDTLTNLEENQWGGNFHTKYFDLKAGDVVRVVMETNGLRQISIGFFGRDDAWNYMSIRPVEPSMGNDYLGNFETEYTVVSDLPVYDLIAITSKHWYTNNYNFSFRIKIYVNGVRYV